jgi:hypothetical protein
MNISIKVIPHRDQRYETPGDWFYDKDGNIEIRVSDTGDWRTDALMAVHELVEVLICKHRGVSMEAVDAFDIQYEKDRKDGKHSQSDEAGDDIEAPYRREHCLATSVERLLAAELDVPWNGYADTVEAFLKDD